MNAIDTLTQVIEAADRRREERRRFLRTAGAATITAGGLSLLAACGGGGSGGDVTTTPTPTPTATSAVSDVDILNFALQLEYLEAQFYSYAVFGTGLPASQTTGTGTAGTVTGGKKVTFTDPSVAAYAREIASDEIAHVAYLRTALGSSAVAMPNINIDGTSNTGAFSKAAQAAGLIGTTQNFDPYASDTNFLLGAFIFEDVGVTAYKGAAPLFSNSTYLSAAAGILAAEAYHAGLIRTALYSRGVATPSLRTSADAISNARDSVDGSSDDDQGITGTSTASNIVPADSNAIVYSRSYGQVLNIVFLNPASVQLGGFFPSGVNGTLNSSFQNG